MATLFFEDFDGDGVGFGDSPFTAWSIGGEPVDAGHWEPFYPAQHGENLTPGTGNYAAVHSLSTEFRDTLVWLISPLIDIENFNQLTLSADVHFRSAGIETGEDLVKVYVLPVGGNPQQVGVIGETMNLNDPPISANMSWEILLKQADLVQIAFTWYSSMAPPEFDSIQLDNIRLEG